MTRLLAISLLLVSNSTARLARAETNDAKVDALVAATAKLPGVIRSDIGVTRRSTRIPCLITADDLDHRTKKTRILLIGGLTGRHPSVKATLQAVSWFRANDAAAGFRDSFAVSAVPVVLPDAWTNAMAGVDRPDVDATGGYPPQGNAYGGAKSPEATYLWRWIGMHAPDLVVLLAAAPGTRPAFPKDGGPALERLRQAMQGDLIPVGDDLVSQLVRGKPSNVGAVPAIRLSAAAGKDSLASLLAAMQRAKFTGPSPARKELQRRLDRSPLDVARQLAKRYGHELNSVVYIPAVALIGRVRLGKLTDDPGHLRDVEKIVAPYFDGKKPTFGNRASGSALSGHLIFGELARVTGKPKYVELAKRAAYLGFDEQGKPRESMPAHNQMSDAVFMGCPILVQTGRLTEDAKYHDMALVHLRFMRKLVARPDGLYRHSPLDEAAWGRGNGFPALGLALCLTDLPEDHPGREEMLRAFRGHLAALVKHQDPTGAWHQVIDHSGSYRELSSTCMITYAMIRGVRSGWLDAKEFAPVIEKAWKAILTRVAPDGTLVDVCTGTGKQKNLRAYFDRTAILGPDPRGGAMALLVATEMAAWRMQKSE